MATGTTMSKAAEFKSRAKMTRRGPSNKNLRSRARSKGHAMVPRTSPIKGPDRGMG